MMATLGSLQTAIETGVLVERTHRGFGIFLFGNYAVKELVYKEGNNYVYVQFNTWRRNPGAASFESFQELVDDDFIYSYVDGMSQWHPCKKHVPHQSGNKFFYLWLINWYEVWKEEQASRQPVLPGCISYE